MDAWTPHASFSLASVLQNASLDLVNCQKAEGARARATRAGATRFYHRCRKASPKTTKLATASARHSFCKLAAGAAARGRGAARTGPDDAVEAQRFASSQHSARAANASLCNK